MCLPPIYQKLELFGAGADCARVMHSGRYRFFTQLVVGNAQDQQEEVPIFVEKNETLVEGVAELAAQDDLEQPAQAASRVLELLLRDRQRQADVALQPGRDGTCVEVAQPPESASELHVGAVPEMLERQLADTDSTGCGDMGWPASVPNPDPTCLRR